MIPYGRQCIDDDDIAAVVAALKSDYLTTGPRVEAFEQAFADYTGARHAVAVSNGTAALHCAMAALDIRPGDEVIVPPITFAATANAVCFLGGTPVFADVEPDTLLIDPDRVRDKLSIKTKAIVGVDYAGQTCDWHALKQLSETHEIPLIADSCQALGAEYNGKKAGALADMTAFSFHPVKHITTGEGGMITTDRDDLHKRLRRFRNHGITSDYKQREEQGAWFYEMTDLGFNYRLTDIQCALGASQLKKLPGFIRRRRELAKLYDNAFRDMEYIAPLFTHPARKHAYHLYVVRIESPRISRDEMFQRLRASGIGVNVHHIPVYLHPFYRKTFGHGPGLCPEAENAYSRILTLPLWPGMTNDDAQDVIKGIKTVLEEE